jgi:hypothetical protein
MTPELLILQFDYSARTFELNLDGVSQAGSLFQPAPAGNCINWVAGHILRHRNPVHRLLELPPAWDKNMAARYDRGSAPVTNAEEAASLEEIRRLMRDSQISVKQILETATMDQLAVADGDQSVGLKLAGLSFHESYHVGQLGVLRRLVGLGPGIV